MRRTTLSKTQQAVHKVLLDSTARKAWRWRPYPVIAFDGLARDGDAVNPRFRHPDGAWVGNKRWIAFNALVDSDLGRAAATMALIGGIDVRNPQGAPFLFEIGEFGAFAWEERKEGDAVLLTGGELTSHEAMDLAAGFLERRDAWGSGFDTRCR